MNLGSNEFEVLFFQIWTWVWLVSGLTGSKFRLFEGVWVCSKFGFGRRTWVQVSSKFDLSSSKQFKVHYFLVRSNTISNATQTFNFFNNVHYRLIIVADDQAQSSLMKNCDLASAGRRTHTTIPLVYECTNFSKF